MSEHLRPATVASYRDAFSMLILFAAARSRKKPAALTLEELGRDLVLAFFTNPRRTGAIPSPRATPAWPRSIFLPPRRCRRPGVLRRRPTRADDSH